MATLTVKQSGGDYTTLAAALSAAAASDIIEISGAWTVDDTSVATVADNDVTIQAIGDSKHPGYTVASPSHYRLRCASNGSHCITVNNTGCVIDGLEIRQGSTGTSDECVRINASITATIQNCLLHANGLVSQQDAVYHGHVSSTINVTNCVIWGFNRCGLHAQFFSSGGNGLSTTWNVNSCTIRGCGHEATSTAAGGGIGVQNSSSTGTITINAFNCVVVGNDNHAFPSEDFRQTVNGATWNIDYCIDSDGSIASRDGGAVGSLASRTATDSASPGAGDWVVFEDVTTSPYDLRLADNAENDAQDMHASSTGAGLTIPSTDALGVSRPQNTNYDCGAFEFSSGGGSALTLEISDALSFSDAPVKDASIAKTETVTMTEALAKAFEQGALTDAIALADALAKDVTLAALVESISLSDSLATAIVLLLEIADSITLADARTVEAQLAKADAVTLAEALAKDITLAAFVESISISDSAATAIVLLLELADALSLSDAGTRQLGKVVADAIALADDAFKTASAIFGDELTLADVVAVVRELSVSVSDSISLGDSTVTQILAVSVAVNIWRAARRESEWPVTRRETEWEANPA